MNYLQDDDDSEDNLALNDPALPSGGAQPSSVRDYLLSKLKESDRDAEFDAKDRAAPIHSDLQNKLAMNDLFAKAAAQAGTLGGKAASAEPMDSLTKQLSASDVQNQGQENEDKQNRMKLNEYLANRVNQQDMLGQKLNAQKTTAQIKADEQASTNKTKVTIAELGRDKKRYQPVGQDEDGNLVVMDVQTGKTRSTDQPIAKVGASTDGSDPKDKKRLDDLGNMLTTGGRNAADFKAHQTIVTNADKILQTEPQMAAQKGGLDKRQIEEVAIASANLLSSGSGGAQATIQALVPHSYGADSAGIKEWLSSEPQGTNQQAFVERMYETAKREKHLAQEKLKGYRADMLGNYSDLAGTDRYDQLKGRYFGQADQFDQQGNYVQKPFGMQDLGAPAGPNAAANSGQAIGAPGGNQIPAKPKTVIQNGHTYTLNPATGKYE